MNEIESRKSFMPTPKGHPNYNTSEDPIENGGLFGYLGIGDNYYTDEDLKELGEGLVKWILKKGNIYCKYYFSPQGITWQTVHHLGQRSPMFKKYLDIAKEIQEAKLVTEPYYKKADAGHARYVLARHHKGEWEEKQNIFEQTNELVKEIANKIKESHNIVVE